MALRGKPTQDFVPIKEIRNGVVILKNGGLRSVLMASSINFALKSPEEQQAILLQFQNFLNVLEFSVQIYVQSRKLDIRPYIAMLEGRIKAQTSELMRIQTTEYIEFVKKFVEDANIMSKTFYLVIPYDPAPNIKKAGLLSKIGAKPSKEEEQEEKDSIEEHRSQLEQRTSIVEQGLSRTGVRVAQLGTEELIELYYKIFNPGEVDKPMQYGNDVTKL
ncbi:MAG TPA: hypothetical protein VFM02_00455 [Candidatus Paceibacterota bacterium]|nr:hypothetical protein [Candidatus Paceibacterota bacterium]